MFWGYQLFIVMAATGYLIGATQSKEYAEPEWYVDLWLTVVWVAYLLAFLGNRPELIVRGGDATFTLPASAAAAPQVKPPANPRALKIRRTRINLSTPDSPAARTGA